LRPYLLDRLTVPTTAEKIKCITDAGAFETLAVRVLREIDADCGAIIHLGINAAGKPIPGPVDGFGQVPNSHPSRYVAAAFTTISLSKLEQKWLGTGSASTSSGPKRKRDRRNRATPKITKSGDLAEAAKKAAAIRATDPDSHFIVILCSNQQLDDKLMAKVFAKAKKVNVEVRFLEQTRLRDFLDTKPEGQWLRREHLGIEVEQVSTSLLKQAAKTNLTEHYGSAVLVTNERVIGTDQTQRTFEALQDRSVSVHLLIGASGIGKSFIGLDVQRRMIDAGRFAFWIPGEVAQKAISVSDALEDLLRSLYPTLIPGAGVRALQIIGDEMPPVLVVDDINRSTAPANVLSKIIRWGHPRASADDQPITTTALQIVCPVWASHWALLQYRNEIQSWTRIQTVQPFLRRESLEFLRSTLAGIPSVHKTELDSFANVLKDDPILLSLFSDTLRRSPNVNPFVIAHDVLRSWSETVIAELSEKTTIPVTEYMSALESLAAEIILRKTLYPKLADLNAWFKIAGNTVQRLLQLAEAGHVCRISSRQGVSIFEFRHDRILEFFVQGALSRMLANEAPIDAAAWDPFFTLFLGRAIAGNICSNVVLDDIVMNNPVALVAAIPYLGACPSIQL